MTNFAYDIKFEDLYQRDGLVKLDAAFIGELAGADVSLHNRLVAARAEPESLADKEHSELLIDLAPHLEDFIGTLFNVRSELQSLAETHNQLAPLYSCKRLFVQRRAAKALKPDEAERVNGKMLLDMLPLPQGSVEVIELSFSKVIMGWLEEEEKHKSLLEVAARYAAWALLSKEGQKKYAKGLLFKRPKKLDMENLVAAETVQRDGITVLRLPKEEQRARDGFKLTDDAGHLKHALDQAHYCIFCHNQGRDYCAKGMKEKTGEVRTNTLNIKQAGCPLDEKISEMNLLKSKGISLGALAMVTVDNPMCAGTGHRICNDCMKSCIYQKQDPVNIPLVETHVLKDILKLPYGFEIYSLLTRWNPLNLSRPLPKPDSEYKILVAGLGPSGYTLAHHLMNDGHTVVGIDGLKIEPVAQQISGVDKDGLRIPFEPIKDIATLYEALDERTLAGFGGVAEYGITVRWDKNYLKIIRLLLERRQQFSMIGGVRFGSSINYDNAFEMGFDHIALCMGAGKPRLIDMPNGLARGVRTASDFLMALQLTGAAKKDSIANLQIRLPIVVIGGGLTAIDTATESLAYYPIQVEKFLSRYEILIAERGKESVRKNWSDEEVIIAEEYISHAKAIRAEKKKSEPDVSGLLDSWGGVKLVYRKRLIDAPSYRLNHEEVEKALEEGIFFAEMFEPKAVNVDEFGHACSIELKQAIGGGQKEPSASEAAPHVSADKRAAGAKNIILPARTILLAAGTSPNTVLQREDPEHFELDGKYFKAIDEDGNSVTPEDICKPKDVRVLMSSDDKGRSVSFFGDLHPSFAGNVVKAMGSAKQGYPVVSTALKHISRQSSVSSSQFAEKINKQLRAKVHEVKRLTPNIIEVIIHAPLAAQSFKPGQFYRLQNFEAYASKIEATILAMEGLAMTGAWVDKEKGLISVIALEMGGSSDLCAHLKVGEPVVLMGPTGTPTHIPKNQTVMLVGGGLGNAVLFSIGKAMRDNGCKVLYFAGYKKAIDRYKEEDIEAAADQIIWCCDEEELSSNRQQDASFHGNIVEAIEAYAQGKLSNETIALSDVKHIIAIGSDRMMAAVAFVRHNQLKPYLSSEHMAIGSINSPMQCMMKEICAQCLQKHVDPDTGKEHYVYSCFNQDQPLDSVSWPHLNQRLKQNSLQEKLTAQWIDRCMCKLQWRTVAS